MTTRIWQAGRFEIGLDKPKIMGIVNLTPDSFPTAAYIRKTPKQPWHTPNSF